MAKDNTPAKAASNDLSLYQYDEDLQGLGRENQTRDDTLIPWLVVLEANSPQCADVKDGGVEGARKGMLFNTATRELYEGDAGPILVPVLTQHVYEAWVPRDQGGGKVGTYQLDHPVVLKAKKRAENGDFAWNELQDEEGHELVETFLLFGMLLESVDSLEPSMPVVMSFTSKRITGYKAMNTKLNTVKGNPPLFAHRLRVTTKSDKNNKGSFYVYEMVPALGSVRDSLIPMRLEDGTRHPILEAGKILHQQIISGERKMDEQAQSSQRRTEKDAADADPVDGGMAGPSPF